MNILIFNWRDPKNPKSGGAEIVTMENARAWVAAGHSVTWFTSSFKGARDKEIIDGVEFIRRGSSLTVHFLAPFYYLFSGKIFDLVVDEIHGLPFFTPLYVKKPKVVLIHEIAGEIWTYMFPFPISIIGKLVEPYFFKFYKNVKFWVPSESTVNDLLKIGIDKKNITMIYCGINNDTLSKLPQKEKIPTFIFVSRIVKMKGIEDVIKAFFFILKDLKYGQLWIVGEGDGEYLKYLKKTMKQYSISTKIKFFGRVDEVEKLRLMRRSHLLMHASIKEGWGLVVIEAASQGTPSVVYDVSGLRDSVINNQTGIVVNSNNPEMLARGAIDLINDDKLYHKFQINCLKRAKKMNWPDSTRQSLELIKNVAKNN